MKMDTTKIDYRKIRINSEEETAEVCRNLAAQLREGNVEYVIKQLEDYAAGNRSSNICDAMCITLGSIRMAMQMKQEYFETVRVLDLRA